MTISKVFLSVTVATVAAASLASSSAFAWHPKGEIIKKVQNITTGSALQDADDIPDAVNAKPGDILKYVITIKNTGDPDNRGWNDMAKTVLTDTLPAGVELTSNPSQHTITENFGIVKPGKSVTKEFTVKVTAKTAGTIKNTACFTGDSTNNDNPQKGCNPAIVMVTVPETPVTPTTPETPKAPKAPAPALPAELPHTGTSETTFVSVLAFGLLWYVGHRYVTSRRQLAKTLGR